MLGSVFAAIAIASIPPSFQFATALLEYVKSEQQLKLDQKNKEAEQLARTQQFRDGYVKDFINTALNQDIELRIRFAEYFSFVSSDTDKWKAYLVELREVRDKKRTEIDKLEADWDRVTRLKPPKPVDESQLERHLKWAYISLVVAEARKFAEFARASTLEQAVSSFVRQIARPGDVPGSILKRTAIAQRIYKF